MYTEKELEKLINEVEKEFTSHLAKAEENFNLAKSEGSSAVVETLVKAEDGKKFEEKKPEEKEEHKESKEGHEEKGPEHKEEGEKAPEGEHAAPPAEDKGHDYDADDMAHLEKMYMSMSDGERKVHHDVIAKLAKCGDMAPSAPTGAAGKQSPDSHSNPSVQKSENSHDEASGGKIEHCAPPKASPGAKSPASKVEGVQMEKSETNSEVELLKSEIAAANAKTEGLQKSLDAVSAFLTKLVEKKVAPQGKAITSLDVVAKSETTKEEKSFSKDEIDTILSKKAQDSKLEKSDRDKINNYCLNGKTDIDSIRHLLK